MKTIDVARRATCVLRPCAESRLQRELVPDFAHDLRRLARRINPQRIRRFFECRELTLEKLRPGIMSDSMCETILEHLRRRAEVDKSQNALCVVRRQRGAIFLLERGARQHRGRVRAIHLLERKSNGGEPRRAIGVGERDALTHARDVLRGMEVVSVEKAPA